MTRLRSRTLLLKHQQKQQPRRNSNHWVAALFLGAAILNTFQTILSVTFLADLENPLLLFHHHGASGPPCRYNGQCPTGMTCAVVAEHDSTSKQHITMDPPNQHRFPPMPGTCVPFAIPESNQQQQQQQRLPADPHCLSACQAELALDEHFYHERFPVVHQHYAVPGAHAKPPGCVLEFTRQSQQQNHISWIDRLHAQDGLYPDDEPQPSIVAWEKMRFRHIQRVDPTNRILLPPTPQTNLSSFSSLNNNNNISFDAPVVWQAYCFAPCRTDRDCGGDYSVLKKQDDAPSPRPFVCMEGACQSNSQFWQESSSSLATTTTHMMDRQQPDSTPTPPSTTTHDDEMILVTGATGSYFRGLQNLAASARYWAPHSKLLIYNLGALEDPDLMRQIEAWPNVLSVEWNQSGIPKDGLYPPHVYEHMRACAWKPLIIQQVVRKYSMIFWLDAGSTLTGPLDPLVNILRRNGLFLVKGQDANMKPMSHPNTYQWFGFDKNTMETGPHFGGGTQGHVRNSRFIHSIVDKNAACALDPNCIIPDLVQQDQQIRHRYDQTSLSICAYHPLVQAPHHTEYLSAGASTVSADLRKASYRFILTSRQSCQAYVQIMSSNEEQSYITNNIVPIDWTKVQNRTVRAIPIHKHHHVTYTDDDVAVENWKDYVQNHTGYKAPVQAHKAKGHVVSLSLTMNAGNALLPNGLT